MLPDLVLECQYPRRIMICQQCLCKEPLVRASLQEDSSLITGQSGFAERRVRCKPPRLPCMSLAPRCANNCACNGHGCVPTLLGVLAVGEAVSFSFSSL